MIENNTFFLVVPLLAAVFFIVLAIFVSQKKKSFRHVLLPNIIVTLFICIATLFTCIAIPSVIHPGRMGLKGEALSREELKKGFTFEIVEVSTSKNVFPLVSIIKKSGNPKSAKILRWNSLSIKPKQGTTFTVKDNKIILIKEPEGRTW